MAAGAKIWLLDIQNNLSKYLICAFVSVLKKSRSLGTALPGIFLLLAATFSFSDPC